MSESNNSRDDSSVYSNKSRTSSIFSTASRMSKIPNAVKSSVKYLVKRNENNESFASKLKRSTFHFISRKQRQIQQPETIYTKQEDQQVSISSDSKSERISKKEEPWTRKRAKSCQENKPMLRQLATKGSFHIPNNTTTIDLPLFKGLVTTTLTTLHTRLMNECDRTLSLLILNQDQSIQEQLLSIISDLYKMTEMVNWQDQEPAKLKVKENIQTLEHIILNQELTIISVKDIVK